MSLLSKELSIKNNLNIKSLYTVSEKEHISLDICVSPYINSTTEQLYKTFKEAVTVGTAIEVYHCKPKYLLSGQYICQHIDSNIAQENHIELPLGYVGAVNDIYTGLVLCH